MSHQRLLMGSAGPAFNPVEHFALSDIALWDTSLARSDEYYSESQYGSAVVQSMRMTSAQELSAEFPGSDETKDVLRAFVKLGVRSILQEAGSEEKVLYSLEATFAVDYFIVKRPTDEQIQDFVIFNCVHNVWPFWRQHVYDTLKRASLSVPVIPFFSGRPDVHHQSPTSP